MFEVRIERIPQGISEKKVLNPTMRMVEFALGNAGFKDGVWILKSPHRTRKKGSERFRAMRIEGMGIRVRCKPGGNDTCYEWTLFPPSDADRDMVFSDLCTLHPSSMRSTKCASVRQEELSILGGFFKRIADAEPVLAIDKVEPRKEEASVADLPCSPVASEEKEAVPEMRETTRSVSEMLARSVPSIDSLDISSTGDSLCTDFALDRALVAFDMASQGSDFMKRNVLSVRLVGLLNVEGLTRKSQIYGSVQGAMRALMMACCSKGYMERVISAGGNTNGYRLTSKGKKRIEFLRGVLQGSLKEDATSCAPVVRDEVGVDEGTISALKELISEHESVRKQAGELRELMKELEGESENDELLLAGIQGALKDKVAERDSLDADIRRLEGKLDLLKASWEKKSSDARELQSELDRVLSRKAEIESRLAVCR